MPLKEAVLLGLFDGVRDGEIVLEIVPLTVREGVIVLDGVAVCERVPDTEEV